MGGWRMINGPFSIDGEQVQRAFSVLIFSHTTAFSRGSNLEHKNNSLAWGKAGGFVFFSCFGRQHAFQEVLPLRGGGGHGLPRCLAKLGSLESPKVIYLIGGFFSFIFMVSV